MNNEISDVKQRLYRYWYSDGIAELSSGGIFMLLGFYFAAQEYLKENSLASGLLQAGLVIVLIGGVFLGRWLIKALKSRLTYPRTGYVEYRVDKQNLNRRRVIVGIVAALIASLSMIFSERVVPHLDLTLALTGILVGLILIVMQGKNSGIERFYAFGGLSILLGIGFAFSGLPNGYSLGLYYGLMGFAFSVSGSIVLSRYLQENPTPAEGEGVHE